MKNAAYIFPGQGAQYIGMGQDFYQEYPRARAIFEEASDLLKQNLVESIAHSSEDDLKQTVNSQLAIFVTSIALLHVFHDLYNVRPLACAGLSLGEYSALVAAGRIPFADALHLVQLRAQAMSRACNTCAGTMRVILGLDDNAVVAACARYAPNVQVANYNCPGQVVISGRTEAVEKAARDCLACGAKKALQMNVSGAFHSTFMAPAAEEMLEPISAACINSSTIGFIANATASFIVDGAEVKQQLLRQITSPVLWHQSIHTIKNAGIDLFIEIGPGKTLTGLNKRIGVPKALNFGQVADIKTIEQELK